MSIYLVAKYAMRPKQHVRTQKKGWMEDNNNFTYDESIAIARSLKKNDIQTSKIILDLSKREVFKNSWSNGKTFDELFSHFYQGYPDYINPIMNQLGYNVVEQPSNIIDTPTPEVTPEVTPQVVDTPALVSSGTISS